MRRLLPDAAVQIRPLAIETPVAGSEFRKALLNEWEKGPLGRGRQTEHLGRERARPGIGRTAGQNLKLLRAVGDARSTGIANLTTGMPA
jgi:hypothetical protein